MTGERLYTLREVADLFKVSTKTVRQWCYDNKINSIRTIGGHIRIHDSEIKKLLGEVVDENQSDRVAIYCRVSSRKQSNDGNLDRQKKRLLEYARDKNYKIVEVYTEVASGLNENRKMLHKLLQLIREQKIDKVLIEFKDRLSRFGYTYLECYARAFGVEIEIVEKKKVKMPQNELVDDLIAIITSFSARIYGMRSQKFKKIKEVIRSEEDQENDRIQDKYT